MEYCVLSSSVSFDTFWKILPKVHSLFQTFVVDKKVPLVLYRHHNKINIFILLINQFQFIFTTFLGQNLNQIFFKFTILSSELTELRFIVVVIVQREPNSKNIECYTDQMDKILKIKYFSFSKLFHKQKWLEIQQRVYLILRKTENISL